MKTRKGFRLIISVLVAALMLACLMPVTAFASPEASFRVKNNNGPGGDHGYILATYNGSSVTIDSNETHTFTYVPGKDNVKIDFIPDTDYQFEYYVIGNGSTHLNANPSSFDVRDYIWKSGSNNIISLNPKWSHFNSYTIDTAVSAGGKITPDQTVNNGSDCTISYSADTGYHLLSVTVDGSDFTHSNPESYTFRNVTSDHSISVVFEANIYDITYNLSGGTVSAPNPATYTVATPTFTLHNPEKQGYEFAGWTGTDLSGNTVTVTVPAGSVGDREYTANWESDEYTVTFSEGAHGNTTGTKTFTGLHYGDPFPAAPEITPEAGWTFDGWATLPATVMGDASYTAEYTQTGYTVTFDIGTNGTTADPTSLSGLHYGDAFPAAPDITPEPGWTFDYWTPELPLTVQGNETYHAHYTPQKYKVTWNNWDGALLEQDTIENGTMPSYDGALPTRLGTAQYDYTFSGWSPAVDEVTGDVTYTAQFTAVLRSYTVTFEDYNGTVLKTNTVFYGAGAAAPANPDNRVGYHFTGWDKNFGNITGPLTVKAQYAINSYRVRFFRADGATQIGASQTVNWGSEASLKTAPSIDGKVFSGWKLKGDDPSVVTSLTNVKENIDAVAVYKTLLYPVTFVDFDGKEIKADNVPYGGNATPPADPVREGYTFTGWSQSYDYVTEKITCEAEYTINVYTVKFADYNGDVIDTQIVEWNTGANVPKDPIRDGYTFTGWDVPFSNITDDTVVTAQYEAMAVPSPSPTAAPSPTPAATAAPEPVPQTGGGAGWLWWLLLIAVIGILWFIIAAKFAVIPIAEAFSDNKDGTYTVYWGYENRKSKKYNVAEDKSVISLIKGKFMKNSADPPVEFEKGRVENVFTTVVEKDAIVQWRINYRKAKVDIKKHE